MNSYDCVIVEISIDGFDLCAPAYRSAIFFK